MSTAFSVMKNNLCRLFTITKRKTVKKNYPKLKNRQKRLMSILSRVGSVPFIGLLLASLFYNSVGIEDNL